MASPGISIVRQHVADHSRARKNPPCNRVSRLTPPRPPHPAPRSRLCEKSVVQFVCRTSVSVSSIRKPIALATSVGRRQLRKQFCASLAHATFHTAWTHLGHGLSQSIDNFIGTAEERCREGET